MLLQLYPRVHRRYSSLPVFGPIVEDFGAWLLKRDHSTDCIREHLSAACSGPRGFCTNEESAAWPS